MCGIIGAISGKSGRIITPILLAGLRKLAYRGYDSAGLGLLDQAKHFQQIRVAGKVSALEAAVNVAPPLSAHLGIAHTRWATHGAPSKENAHPFVSGQFVLVHNGIIENHLTLRSQLLTKGYHFTSETDTETAAHWIHYRFTEINQVLPTLRAAMNDFEGVFAIGLFCTDDPKRLFGIRQGAPLVIGRGEKEHFIASDPIALREVTQRFIHLEDGDIVELTDKTIHHYDKAHLTVRRSVQTLSSPTTLVERGSYRHYMEKEIMEQPQAMAACLATRLVGNRLADPLVDGLSTKQLQRVKHLQLVACGTSYHAALIARYWLAAYAALPCAVEVASEFRYHAIAPPKNSLFVAISQSGETADTLAALQLAQQQSYLKTLAICNVANSTMTRLADAHFLTQAGIEIGVASTKAFTTQLIALCLLTLSFCQASASSLEGSELATHLQALPDMAKIILEQASQLEAWAHLLYQQPQALFLGRGSLYPVALEGALKLKEVSYLHAEGYPAGELKHGPLALVEKETPVIALITKGPLFEKTVSNLQEVLARGGKLFILTDTLSLKASSSFQQSMMLVLPTSHPMLTPILYTIPLQLLAYYVAVLKGTEVDEPRNLAKSVTVE